jgi:hypothetical protein
MADQSNSLARLRSTSLAFDELIVQIGKAISTAQQEMDRAHIEFQREVARAVRERGLTQLDVHAANAYTIPETKLSLRIGLSLRFPEDGGEPSLEAVPVNASSAAEGEVDLSTTTEIELRFVAVPQTQEPPPLPTSRLTPAEIEAMLGEPWLADARPRGGTTRLEELSEDRLWLSTTLVAREPEMLVVIDDRKSDVLAAIVQAQRPRPEQLEPIGPPVLGDASPSRGTRAEIIEMSGDNLLTLGGQTTLALDGRSVPIVRHGMRKIAFTVPPWATRGDIEISTALGKVTRPAAFVPVPSISSFEPRQGTYDAIRRQGTWVTVSGSNLRPGCSIRFAGGAIATKVEFVSETRMQVEVPEGASTGPLCLVLADSDHVQYLLDFFVVLPRVDRVSPRQAEVGDELTIIGNHLLDIQAIAVGRAEIPASEFNLDTPTQIRLRVPPGATDGPLLLRASGQAGAVVEIRTRDIFYVIPAITGFVQRIALPGQLLTVQGEGLDPEPDMMTLLFDARGGISEAPVLSVSNDRRTFTTRVPLDAATGYLVLLRKKIYSGRSPADTSFTTDNKLTVLTLDGIAADVLVDERFSAGEAALVGWSIESGIWSVAGGQLACTGTGRLGRALTQPTATLILHAEVLRAGRFGLSLRLAGSSEQLQLWINLSDAGSALTWSSLDQQGNQVLLASSALAELPGGDHLLSLRCEPSLDASMRLRVAIDQVDVHELSRPAATFTGFALLSDIADQRWDNIVALARDVLSLAEPGAYRFAPISVDPTLGIPRIDQATPALGGPGTLVELVGANLQDVVYAFVGGQETSLELVEPQRVTLRVPEGANTGPIELRSRAGMTIVSSTVHVIPPVITDVVPSKVLVGQTIQVIGRNLPVELGTFSVSVLGLQADVIAATSSMLTVLVPDVVGEGVVELEQLGFTAASASLLAVTRERVLLDLVEAAASASWTVGGEAVAFGGAEVGPGIVLRPPKLGVGKLQGRFAGVPLGGEMVLRLQCEVDFGNAGAVTFMVALVVDGAMSMLVPASRVFPGETSRLEVSVVGTGPGVLVVDAYRENGQEQTTARLSGQLVVRG